MMKHMFETIYGPGYFSNLSGLKEDIRAIKFVLFRMFSDRFQDIFNKYYHVFGGRSFAGSDSQKTSFFRVWCAPS